jgi:hypothetical protein
MPASVEGAGVDEESPPSLFYAVGLTLKENGEERRLAERQAQAHTDALLQAKHVDKNRLEEEE